MRRADRRARTMRKNMPPAEVKLWSLIRRQQLGYKFRRQVSIGPYYADFACVLLKLAIELDGAQHATGAAMERDSIRDDYFQKEGWVVLRFWNHEVMESPDDVLWAIRSCCLERSSGRKG